MSNLTSRVCKECGRKIPICKDDVNGIVYYKKAYYHTACFCKLAEYNSKQKRGKPSDWAYALENIQEFERQAMEALNAPRHRTAGAQSTDKLNEYLLSYYQVDRISSSNFWRTVKGLENGIYKGKRCQKVSLDLLLNAWMWAQPKLDKINRRNKQMKKGPKDNKERIPYDLAILVGHISDYLSYKARQIAEQAEVRTQLPRINYDSMERTVVKRDGLGDISDLLNDDDDD